MMAAGGRLWLWRVLASAGAWAAGGAGGAAAAPSGSIIVAGGAGVALAPDGRFPSGYPDEGTAGTRTRT